MNTIYQVIFVGGNNSFRSGIEKTLYERVDDLGLDRSLVKIIDRNNRNDYKSICPSVTVYFGDTSKSLDVAFVKDLLNDACPIIPVVDNLASFTSLVIDELRPLNGFVLNEENADQKVPALVSRLLESLSLLRRSRKLFISYRRNESRTAALQLYGCFDERGYNVFLDTHAIGPGAKFQDELWHSLADTDVLLLLNTNDFVGNKWTDAELAKASGMSVGITQLIWPECKNVANAKTGLAIPTYLDKTDFENSVFDSSGKFSEAFLKRLETEIESLRARALAARRDNLIKEFLRSAQTRNADCSLQPEKTFIIKTATKNVAVIPAVGVPDVYSSYQREALLKSSVAEVTILYDHRNILEEYLVFVDWLNPLPVKFLKIVDADQWLQNNGV